HSQNAGNRTAGVQREIVGVDCAAAQGEKLTDAAVLGPHGCLRASGQVELIRQTRSLRERRTSGVVNDNAGQPLTIPKALHDTPELLPRASLESGLNNFLETFCQDRGAAFQVGPEPLLLRVDLVASDSESDGADAEYQRENQPKTELQGILRNGTEAAAAHRRMRSNWVHALIWAGWKGAMAPAKEEEWAGTWGFNSWQRQAVRCRTSAPSLQADARFSCR